MNEMNEERKEERKEKKPIKNKIKRNKFQYIEVAKQKLTAKYPSVVEFHDVNSKEPELLNELKGMKNTVPVPNHWFRKKYAPKASNQSMYQLPDYIIKTGVTELRQSYIEKENDMKLKQKMKEKVRPKQVGCIDYQTLYNAFFTDQEQKKCQLTSFGELFHESKERKLQGYPFHLSSELRNALGIGEKDSPPWLHAMEKYGPPPSYKTIMTQISGECLFKYD